MTTILGDDEPTAVYRIFGEDDVLLYIGMTDNLRYRLLQHAADKPWWPAAKRKTVEWYGTRDEAAVAELAAIREERPLHNRAGLPSWQRLAKPKIPYLPPCPVLVRPERVLEQIRELAMRKDVSPAEFRLMVACLVSTGNMKLPTGRKLEYLAESCGLSGRTAYKVRADSRRKPKPG